MRTLAALISAMTCVAISGCVRPPPSMPPADYQKDIEDQLGITRARQRAEACTKIPPPSIGMTEAKVLSSCWGNPDNNAQSVTASGKQAIWSYPEGYVYLTNGIVTKIVTAR